MPLVHRPDAKQIYENLYDSETSDCQLIRTSKSLSKLLLSSENHSFPQCVFLLYKKPPADTGGTSALTINIHYENFLLDPIT